MNPATYRTYRDLPPVAGISSFTEAAAIGLSIDDCVARLKRHHWAWRRLHQIFVDRITSEPIYELKMGFSLHAHYCAEHAAAWRDRVGEMREPPLGLDAVPNAALEVFFDEILCAPDTASLLVGLYEYALPRLLQALKRHMAETNRLVDHPSFRICRFAATEVEEMCVYGARCVAQLITAEKRGQLSPWTEALSRLLATAGDLDGSAPMVDGEPERQFSRRSHIYDSIPRRDERFVDPYNLAVHAEVFLNEEGFPAAPKPLMLYYKRLREIDVPEMMAAIITETPGKPWAYYVDMTRQLWDEARHAIMGEVGFVRAGIDWQKYVRVNFTWSRALNTQLTALERHAVLYFIEQGLMPKTGKRFEWEVAIASGDPFAAMIQDYDWADEVLHTRIGRDWYAKLIGSTKTAAEYGEKCWAKVVIDWEGYRAQGLTGHENWWPALYGAWCRLNGRTPEDPVLRFDTSYAPPSLGLEETGAVR